MKNWQIFLAFGIALGSITSARALDIEFQKTTALRDIFAAVACGGFCTKLGSSTCKTIGEDSYAIADQMLAARGGKK